MGARAFEVEQDLPDVDFSVDLRYGIFDTNSGRKF